MANQAHNPKKEWPLPWVFCIRCGLIYLRNEATQKAIKEPCKGAE